MRMNKINPDRFKCNFFFFFVHFIHGLEERRTSGTTPLPSGDVGSF